MALLELGDRAARDLGQPTADRCALGLVGQPGRSLFVKLLLGVEGVTRQSDQGREVVVGQPAAALGVEDQEALLRCEGVLAERLRLLERRPAGRGGAGAQPGVVTGP